MVALAGLGTLLGFGSLRRISARVVQQEAPGELLMVTAWSMTAQWVAGVWARGPLGAEVGMTTSG